MLEAGLEMPPSSSQFNLNNTNFITCYPAKVAVRSESHVHEVFLCVRTSPDFSCDMNKYLRNAGFCIYIPLKYHSNKY